MGAPAVIGFLTGKVLQKGTKEAIKKLGGKAQAERRLKTKTKEQRKENPIEEVLKPTGADKLIKRMDEGIYLGIVKDLKNVIPSIHRMEQSKIRSVVNAIKKDLIAKQKTEKLTSAEKKALETLKQFKGFKKGEKSAKNKKNNVKK